MHLPRPRHLRPRPWLLACALTLAIAGQASADAVTDWNANFDAVAPAYGGPPQRAYLGAMVHIAIHDALNSIQRRYETYDAVPTANANASPDAAIAAAAHDVLIHELNRPPASAAKTNAIASIEASYATALAAIPAGPARDQGVAAGQAAANAIIQARNLDGSATPNLPLSLAPGPGVYQPTAPNFPAAANNGWALVKPFAMHEPSQFRSDPGEIFDLAGAAYARDYNEVKQVGELNARLGNPDSVRSDVARFWPAGGADWNLVTRTIVASRNLDRWQHARLFALMQMGEADAAISVFDTKYAYNYWRPVTAIRWNGGDGNPATTADPSWLPFFSFGPVWATPPYPDYPCGLTTAAGATTEVLRRYFGSDQVGYTLTVTAPAFGGLPAKPITRTFASLSAATADAVDARVFAGIHFRSGCVQGVRQGSQVGRYAIQHYLRPVK